MAAPISHTDIDRLAILGGTPAFTETLHVGRPNIGRQEDFEKRMRDIWERKWFTNEGPYVEEFERRIAEIAQVKHCVVMCNATVGLEIAIRALGLSGEVILPSFTFIATAHALQWQEITPIFCDIDPHTHTLDPNRLEQLITSRTSGIVGVHLWGRPCDTTTIASIAKRRGLKVIYDAAHAFGCSQNGRSVGSFGECEVFSFHATKVINSFEGGAVVTNNDILAQKMRLMRNFGFATYDDVVHLGVNGKMTEVCAAMGLTSLEAMPEIVRVNRANWEIYRQHLTHLPGVSIIEYDLNETNNYQYVVIEVDPKQAPLDRDEVLAVLHKENVLARRYFWPGCHRMEPYRSLYPDAHSSLQNTERVAARVLTLPTGQEVTAETIRVITQLIRLAFENADEVRRVLGKKLVAMDS